MGGTILTPQEQTSQNIVNFLPFLIAGFTINVPAGLSLYWIFNNICTTLFRWPFAGHPEGRLAAVGGDSHGQSRSEGATSERRPCTCTGWRWLHILRAARTKEASVKDARQKRGEGQKQG